MGSGDRKLPNAKRDQMGKLPYHVDGPTELLRPLQKVMLLLRDTRRVPADEETATQVSDV